MFINLNNKKNRVKIYNYLIKRWKIKLSLAKKNNLFFAQGICSDLALLFDYPMLIEDFPELLALKPSETKNGKLWWRTDTIKGVETRLNCLIEAKAMCAPKKKIVEN